MIFSYFNDQGTDSEFLQDLSLQSIAALAAPAAATGTTKRTGSKRTQEHINIIYEHIKTRKARNRRQMTSLISLFRNFRCQRNMFLRLNRDLDQNDHDRQLLFYLFHAMHDVTPSAVAMADRILIAV